MWPRLSFQGHVYEEVTLIISYCSILLHIINILWVLFMCSYISMCLSHGLRDIVRHWYFTDCKKLICRCQTLIVIKTGLAIVQHSACYLVLCGPYEYSSIPQNVLMVNLFKKGSKSCWRKRKTMKFLLNILYDLLIDFTWLVLNNYKSIVLVWLQDCVKYWCNLANL
jgi:hypothetical protein